jgi:hypothetical protein
MQKKKPQKRDRSNRSPLNYYLLINTLDRKHRFATFIKLYISLSI